MGLAVRLLGVPSIERDDRAGTRVRGHKAWAVLAYLLLNERPPSRQRLATLLFADADDPLGALRWSIMELRRALGSAATIGGDPVRLTLDPSACVDVLDILGGRWAASGDTSGELLESYYFRGSPGFEAWLLVTRRRLTALVEAATVQHIQAALAAGTPEAAIESAARLVQANPLDEGHQALLVRCLADSGDRVAASRQLADATNLLHAELGVEPSDELRTAALGRSRAGLAEGPAAVRANIDAGRAAIAAGAIDAGILCLRTAVLGAESDGDTALQARALSTFGASLARIGNSFAEAEAMLRRGLTAAVEAGDRQSAVVAHRELGFLRVQAGYRAEGDQHLTTAIELAAGDASQLASILGSRGMSLSDEARYDEAKRCLSESIEHARRCERHRKVGWSLSMLGRVHLLLGELVEAADALDESRRIARVDRWSAFLPWPETLGAEVDLALGRVDDAHRDLEHAVALAGHLQDPGLQGFATHGLAAVAACAGDIPAALARTDAARQLVWACSRPYVWIQAQIAARRATLYTEHRPSQAGAAIDEWIDLAARAGLREDIVRAQFTAARSGRAGALEAATILAADIDNPSLHRHLAETPLRSVRHTAAHTDA